MQCGRGHIRCLDLPRCQLQGVGASQRTADSGHTDAAGGAWLHLGTRGPAVHHPCRGFSGQMEEQAMEGSAQVRSVPSKALSHRLDLRALPSSLVGLVLLVPLQRASLQFCPPDPRPQASGTAWANWERWNAEPTPQTPGLLFVLPAPTSLPAVKSRFRASAGHCPNLASILDRTT